MHDNCMVLSLLLLLPPLRRVWPPLLFLLFPVVAAVVAAVAVYPAVAAAAVAAVADMQAELT